MPTTEALQPDEDDEYEDDELPPDFLIFTCPDLDRDEEKARKAGDKIDNILRRILNEAGDLEYIERALREAEPTSTRARRAREQLLSALSGIDGCGRRGRQRPRCVDLPLEHPHSVGRTLNAALVRPVQEYGRSIMLRT